MFWRFRVTDSYVVPYDYNKDVKGGGFGAILGATGISICGSLPSVAIMNAMQKAHNLPEKDIAEIKEAAQKILKKQGLSDSGVNIKYLKKFTGLEPEAKYWHFFDSLVRSGNNAGFVDKDMKGINFENFKKKVIS